MAELGTYSSCGFCHTKCDVDVDECPTCGHHAHVALAYCRCGRPGCLDTAGRFVPPSAPSAEEMADAIAGIEPLEMRGVSLAEMQADLQRLTETNTAPAAQPLTREQAEAFARGEQVDEHVYLPGDVFCLQCGVHIAEATSKPCGPR